MFFIARGKYCVVILQTCEFEKKLVRSMANRINGYNFKLNENLTLTGNHMNGPKLLNL